MGRWGVAAMVWTGFQGTCGRRAVEVAEPPVQVVEEVGAPPDRRPPPGPTPVGLEGPGTATSCLHRPCRPCVGTVRVDSAAWLGAEPQKSVRRSVGQLAYCYERKLVRDPTLAGTLEVEMSFGAVRGTDEGRLDVHGMDVVSGSLPLELLDCVRKKIRRWPLTLDEEPLHGRGRLSLRFAPHPVGCGADPIDPEALASPGGRSPMVQLPPQE